MKKDINLNNVSATRKYVDDAIKNIEIPEGFSGDYNDLINKPFYDTREYEDVVIEYDGNTEGRTICSLPALGMRTAYKVADLTAEQLELYSTSCANGFTLTYLKEDGSTEVVQSSIVYGFMGTSKYLYAGGLGQVFLAVEPFSTEIGHADNYVNEAGIYFKENTGTNPYKVIKLEFQNTTGDLKIIEPQFLTNSPGIKVEEGKSYISQYNSQTYVSQNNAEIFNDTHNMATGQYSHAEGTMTEAHGNYSHAEGNGTTAIGEYSHAEGAHTQATGRASHSEGWSTTASGWYSHAEGTSTTAEGDYSHAEGNFNHAIGDNSHAEGTYNKAYGDCQHVQGKHAIPDEEGRYAHIVGNGEYAQNRKKDSNAHTLDWDGNAWFAGDVFVGGTSQDDAQKLVTEESVNDAINIDYETLAFDIYEIIDELVLPDSTLLDASQLGLMMLSGEDISSFALKASDSYNRQNFVPYQVLKADHLNNIEDGIIANENAISNMESDIADNNAALSDKQDILVSGGNIKTINGESILGSGDISIESGGSTGSASAINYDLNIKAVNHRGYSKGAPENTIPAYIMSKEKGYTYVECDVAFTKDSVAVLLHDSTINRTSNGSGNIGSFTYEELLQYDFGSWFSSKFAGTTIPTFKEFIMYCKGLGMHPYIELKSSGGYTESQIRQVVDEVELCGMKGKVTYISFSSTFLQYVKNYDEEARLGFLADVTNATITTANGLKTGKNEVFMDVNYTYVNDSKVALCMANDLPMEVWTVNDANTIKKLNPYISGVTSDNQVAGKILYNLYSTYTNTTYVSATSIGLNKTSLTFENLKTQTLTATVLPSNASGNVVWKSSNTSVATVSNGIVTPIKDGSCTITASIDSVSASCSITIATAAKIYSVTENLTGCTSSNTAVNVIEGEAYTDTFKSTLGYTLEGAIISITMGGTNVSSYYNNGTLNIPSVTGDIVVTIIAKEKEIVMYNITRNLTNCTS
jgi:glycerophosphoryl diester phosphodiesterase